MKKLSLLALFLYLSVSLSAQIIFDHDTVYNDLVLGVKTEVKVWVRNGSTSPIDAQYRIYSDNVVDQTDWDVQFCDCDLCRSPYPTTGVCVLSNPMTGEKPHSYTLYVTPQSVIENRELKLIVMSMADTTVRDTVVFKTRLATSVEEKSRVEQSLQLMPNPASNMTHLQFENTQNGPTTVELVSLLGETVRSYTLDAPIGPADVPIELSGLNSGIYLVQIHFQDFSVSRKLQVR
ncbi:T9SS type A sorting domain-containing protein [bacterium SCSIO 12741]|nr:T9SS type A sorting domain-containing protein [bacterium SCSIO 12741]